MFLFYAPEMGESGVCSLSPEESFHCAKVLRMRPGQALRLTDGNGLLCDAELVVVDARCCAAQVTRVLKRPDEEGNTRPSVHIVMAPTKNMDRTEWFLEKAIEVGLGRASFVQCARSERKSLKIERLEAIAVSAMKQSLHTYLPRIDGLCSLETFLDKEARDSASRSEKSEASHPVQTTSDTLPTTLLSEEKKNEDKGKNRNRPLQKFIAYCGPEYEKKDYLKLLDPKADARVLIGPEGDFSPEEVALCVNHGYIPVSLGESRLRTETAALYAAWGPTFLKARSS